MLPNHHPLIQKLVALAALIILTHPIMVKPGTDQHQAQNDSTPQELSGKRRAARELLKFASIDQDKAEFVQQRATVRTYTPGATGSPFSSVTPAAYWGVRHAAGKS